MRGPVAGGGGGRRPEQMRFWTDEEAVSSGMPVRGAKALTWRQK